RMSRAAEVLGGLGAGGVVKAGATALVAGTLVVTAVKAPLPVLDHHKTSHPKAHAASATNTPASSAGVSSATVPSVARAGHGAGPAAAITHGGQGRALGHTRHGGSPTATEHRHSALRGTGEGHSR